MLEDPTSSEQLTLGQFLAGGSFSEGFVEWHLRPLFAAVWSADPRTLEEASALAFLGFIDNHGLNASATQALVVSSKTLYPPEITAYSPEADSPVIYLGESQKFTITLYQKEPSPLAITWSVDGTETASNATSFTYEPEAPVSYDILVSVSDGIFEPVTHSWTLVVTDEQVEDIHEEHEQTGKTVRHMLVDMEILSEDDLLSVIAGELGTRVVNLPATDIPVDVIHSVPASVARMYNAVPVEMGVNSVVLAVSDLASPTTMDELMFALTRDVSFVLSREDDVKNCLNQFSWYSRLWKVLFERIA